MKATRWTPITSGALRGFFDLELPSGLKLIGCSLYEKDGRRWINLPSKVEIDREGKAKTDLAGKRSYTDTVEIIGKDKRERFQEAALAAVETICSVGC